jgi:hypothetical protein
LNSKRPICRNFGRSFSKTSLQIFPKHCGLRNSLDIRRIPSPAPRSQRFPMRRQRLQISYNLSNANYSGGVAGERTHILSRLQNNTYVSRTLRSATVFLDRGIEPRGRVYGAEARIRQGSCDRRLSNCITRQQHCTGLYDTGTDRGTMRSKIDTAAPHSPLLGTAIRG